ncbi:unnamed protein product [Rhodiola kirilowii]
MNDIWGSAVVGLVMFLGILMTLCSISGGCGWSLPFSGEPELGGLISEMDETGARLEGYIGEIYFRKYDRLDDSHFQNVVERELSGRSCEALGKNSELMLKLSLLERYLIGEGSHRRLSTAFRLELAFESQSEIGTGACEVIFVERLPLGVSADPFELQHLRQRGVFKEAYVFGDTNLELPSFLSNRSLVEVHMDVDFSRLSNEVELKLELPLHGRYQPLDDSGYTNVEFGSPDIFLYCKMINRPNIKSCVSILRDEGSKLRPNAIIWSMPSGIKAHTGVVSLVTFLSAILSTMLIVVASMRHSDG